MIPLLLSDLAVSFPLLAESKAAYGIETTGPIEHEAKSGLVE